MSSTRPTLRHGLPYGWWRGVDFWMGVLALGSALLTFGLLTVLILAWWT